MKIINSLLVLLAMTQTAFGITCTNELDSQYEVFPEWMKTTSFSKVDKSCVSLSMNIFSSWAQALGYDESGEKGVFIYCSEDQRRRSSIPQCQTDSYLNITMNSYASVMDCLGVEMRNLYPIIATESGFYHNAISLSSRDFGFGQVTAPAISDVSRDWNKFLDEMKGSTKLSCQNLVSLIEEQDLEPVTDDFECTLTVAPKNPLLNALYTGKHYRLITSYMEMYSERTHMKSRLENYLGENFSLERFEKIKALLVILSYNLGHDGTVMAFDQFLLEKEHELEILLGKREDVSSELAKVNFALLSKPSRKLKKKKIQLLVDLKEIDDDITAHRNPQQFNGTEDAGAFGQYIVERGISKYLRALYNRMKSISRRDKEGLCPFDDLFIIH